jgi:hypothetical protein
MWPADPLPVDGEGIMEFDGLVGKPWYTKTINNGDPMNGDGLPNWAASTGGAGGDNRRQRIVRGWAPYLEDFTNTRTTNGTSDATQHATATNPFISWQSPAEDWSGIQSLSEARAETASWFSPRFQEFSDLHFGLDIDYTRAQPGRTKHGILCTIPFDTHFETALIPPNGVIFADGYIVPRNNPEAQFGNWLIIDEVYKFLGEQEGDWEKYIWRNGQLMNWQSHLNSTAEETAARLYHLQAIADEKYKDESMADKAKISPDLAKLRDPMFPVDDPITSFDYYRVTWGRPGHPTIAKRVYDRVNPIMAAYYAGEDLHAPPSSANKADTYHDAARASAAATAGPKFKPMDWRGLLDEPEDL